MSWEGLHIYGHRDCNKVGSDLLAHSIEHEGLSTLAPGAPVHSSKCPTPLPSVSTVTAGRGTVGGAGRGVKGYQHAKPPPIQPV